MFNLQRTTHESRDVKNVEFKASEIGTLFIRKNDSKGEMSHHITARVSVDDA